MYNGLLRVGALALALLFITDATAQDQPRPFLRVDFMKSSHSSYGDVESMMWKPVHQDLVNRGDKLGWSLYWVNYGDRTEHDYATVSVYPTYESMGAESYEEAFARVHPEFKISDVWAKTGESRDQVRSERWRLLLFEGEQGSHETARINYMKVPEGGGADYVAMEEDWWAPLQRAMIAKGCLSAWGVYVMQAPWGTHTPYNYAAVNFSNSDDTGQCNLTEIAAAVHPDTEWSVISEKTEASRELVSGVEWTLMDDTTPVPQGN